MPKAQNNETTFNNYNSLMQYFSNYIIKHNKHILSVIPFTNKHYKILTSKSSYLKIKTPASSSSP
jgi:hypothetical protein